ncbi:MAG: peptide chain release factor 1 [Chitinophagales bacterium]
MDLISKLQSIKERWLNIQEQLSDPEIIADMKHFKQLNKDYRDMEPVVETYEKYKNVLGNLQDSKRILQSEKDEEMRELAKAEIADMEEQQEILEKEIQQLLLPKDPEDEKDAILEIRAGTGGDEAALFAGDLFEMYTRFCNKQGWKTEVINMSASEKGGYKEIVFEITGEQVYGRLKYESGVHRVQRVPETESQGRVHTSAATVAVLPEAEEFDVDINVSDIKVDVFRASGAGGQHVNRTESAVRMTHLPTGIVAECQDERSQIKNREKAMKVLRTRVYEKFYNEHLDKISKQRKTLVSTGDRSAKIRTYNFPQSRVTDHRINLTLYNLPDVMNGYIEEIIDALQIAENAEKMKTGSSI